MAVDGDIITDWQTKRASGKKASPNEWIEVDLGSVATINQIVLRWNDNFATAYDVESSVDGTNWFPIFSTQVGTGSTDLLTFSDTSAMYVRMNSSAWNDPVLRNWLGEFEIYGSAGSPPPPDTATPTPTPTPGTTPPGSLSMHLGGLIGSTRSVGKNWRATVSITVHREDETPLSGVLVNGSWSNGYTGSTSCITDSIGSCSLSSGNVDRQVATVIFTIDQVTLASYSYQAAANHDPAGNSIQISAP